MDVLGGATNVTQYFVMRLTADGTAATNLTITDMDLQYVRSGELPSAKVDATALSAADDAHADNKAIQIDATDQPGLYRVDFPDAAFVAGVPEVILTVKCATAFTEHKSVPIDPPVGGMSTAMKAEVNAEVADVLKTDTISQLAQGAMSSTPTFQEAIMSIYQYLWNKREQTDDLMSMFNAAGTTVDHKAVLSDDDTTFTKGEIESGP